MKKQRFSLLIILAAIAVIFVAGCTSPTQNNVAPANLTENTSTSTSTTTSSAVSKTATISPSPSPSPTKTPSPSPTSSPAPSSEKIATSIDANKFFDTDNTITQGSAKTVWAFNVVSQKTGLTICGVSLTATIDGSPKGTLTSQGANCIQTANYALSAQDTAGLSVGTHTLTISFAGDNTYQPVKQDFQIVVS